MKSLSWLYATIEAVILCLMFVTAKSSNGDRSYIFDKCLRRCLQNNCSHDEPFLYNQPKNLQLLSWSCEGECQYDCMWHTVDAYQRDGSGVPQFYGKWPFTRFAGIQEPASMIFSLLNALSHFAIFYFRAKVPSSADMYYVWHGMAVVSSVTWLCAMVFHTRDTPLTEKLDYFSAFALVLYNLFTLFCKLIGSANAALKVSAAVPCLALYFYHINCLLDHFDYGYNMKVNIGVGALNAIGWIGWCHYHRKKRLHVWKCFLTIMGLNTLLMLELGDFAPFFWVFDAHAIWHAGTVVLNLLWYSFIIDESLHALSDDAKSTYKKMI